MADPLTLRYNNPGAVEYKPWMSQYGARVGENGRYAAFDSPDQGYSVMGRILDTYQNKHGLNTVSGIINRWAPSNVDNNSANQYVASVAKRIGIDPNAPLGPEHRQPLMRAMAAYEAGRAVPGPSGTMPPPMMLGGPQPSPQQGASSMPQEQPKGLPGLLGGLQAGFMSPLFQMGLGTYNAGAEGKNWAGGLLAGSQGYQQQRGQQLQNRQHELAVQQAEQARNYVGNLDPNDPMFKGLPPGLVAMAQGMGDPSLLTKAYASKMDLDQQERMARMQGNIALANAIAQKKATLEAERESTRETLQWMDKYRQSRGGAPASVRRYDPATGEIK